MMKQLFLTLLCVLLAVVVVRADVPDTITVHGQLLDDTGTPLTGNRDYEITFYDAEVDGTPLGTTFTGTTELSLEGIFDIPLVLSEEAKVVAELWYAIAVDSDAVANGIDGNDVFPNRIKVESVPFALQADTVASIPLLEGVTTPVQEQLDAKADTGNVYSKAEVDTSQDAQDTEIAAKANVIDVYTQAEIDATQAAQDTEIVLKANAADVYTQIEIDDSQALQDVAIAEKANTADVYSKTEVDASQEVQDTAIASKANTADVYTSTEVDDLQAVQDAATALKADADSVYTKAEVDTSQAAQDTLINQKANAADVYTQGEVDASQSAQDTEIALKANAVDVYTKGEVDASQAVQDTVISDTIAAKANRDEVYTKAEVDTSQAAQDTLINQKANAADVYTQVEVDSKLFSWSEASDAAYQMEPNRGYLATRSASIVTFTLPLSADCTLGDIIRVSGAGAGGWKVIQNAGQYIPLNGLEVSNLGATVTALNAGSSRSWYNVACSADGACVAATSYTYYIRASSDSGAIWTGLTAGPSDYDSIAVSADGNAIIAFDGGNNTVYVSQDFGTTWMSYAVGGASNWYEPACSADGSVIVVSGGNAGNVRVSSDSGVTWTASNVVGASTVRGVDCSNDGSRMIIAGYGSDVFISVDSGTTWTASGAPDGKRYWDVASSDSGQKLVAVEWMGGAIFTSADGGTTWTRRHEAGLRDWRCVDCSADGSTIVAGVASDAGYLYVSKDSGTTWTQCDYGGIQNWMSVAVTADGSRFFATYGDPNGDIMSSTVTFNLETTSISTGSLSGSQGDAVELQYVGNDRFHILSHQGNLGAN